MKLSVVIAAYNEAENIAPLTQRIVSTLSALDDSTWELIYVIEGTDETLSIAESFAARHPEIKILYNPVPSGLAAAFRRGFSAVSRDADLVVTMDADLNHQPEEIPRLVGALFSSGADIVVGSRKVQGSTAVGTPVWKRALSDTFNRSMRMLIGSPVADMTSGYRVYRAKTLFELCFDNNGFAFLPEMLMRAHAKGCRIVEQPIQFLFRIAGESKMKLLPTTISYAKLLAARFLSVWTIVAALIIIVAIATRVLLAYPVHKFHADSDAVLAGLCGLNVLKGEHPVFFPGGHRLGAQSCYVTAASFFLFGISRSSLALTGILFFSLFMVFAYLYLREAFGPRAGLAGLLLAALPPFEIVINTYVAWAYGEILMYCTSTLWLATLVTRRYWNGWFFFLGLSAGLAFWCSAQSLMVTLPVALWLFICRVFTSRKKIAAVSAGFFVGTLPLSTFILIDGLSKISNEGAVHPVTVFAQLSSNISYLAFHLIPWLLAEAQGSDLSFRSGTAMVMLVYAIAALFIVGLSVWPSSVLRRKPELWMHTLLLGLIVLFCVGLFVPSEAGSVRGWTVRYILPLYLVVPGVAAVLFSASKKPGQLIALTLIAFLAIMNVKMYPFEGSSLRRSLDNGLAADQRLIRALEQDHIQAVIGDYWDVYSLNFDSKTALTGVPVLKNEDYFAFGDRLAARHLTWALLDESLPHLTEWEHKLSLQGETFPLAANRFVFVPNTKPAAQTKSFLSLARTSAP